ncbi:hypothetical protein ACFLXA_04460 [Chloroflexota bacterium]
MPQLQHSPIALFAFPRFQRDFGKLINSNALLTDFTLALIDAIFEDIMWFGRTKKDYTQFERTAHAAYHFLQEGNNIDPKAIAHQYSLIADKIIHSLNNSRLALSEAKNVSSENPDNHIRKYLGAYKVMYEGLYCLVCAPVIYAFGTAKRVKDKRFTPDENGKISLSTLKAMEKLIIYSDNRLAIGLNNHIRNAYSHENYRILDGAMVELWDPNTYRPTKSWGPEVWPLEKLIKLNDQLWINALGIICALILYDANNRESATARGWFTPRQSTQLRLGELKDTITYIADKLGFYMKELTESSRKISITLLPQLKGIDQDSDLYMGDDNRIYLYKVKMWYEEKRIIDQLTRMFITLVPYIKADSEVTFNIVSHEGELLGVLSVDLPDIVGLNLSDTDPDTVNSIRSVYKIDTVGENSTYVEKKGNPRFIGIGPAVPMPGASDTQ